MAPRSRNAARNRLDPNLASTPFVNARPVERLSALLWVLALAVGALAYWSTSSSRQEAASRRAGIEQLSAETAALRERATRLRAELEGGDLAGRNERTLFLNQRIAERAFSWNDLIDALGEVLPRGVRLRDLTPQGFGVTSGGRRASAESPATSAVTLRISGEAEDGEALLEFVDRLYRHAAFDEPNLERESTQKNLQLEFSLGVDYVPGWRSATEAVATAAPGAPPIASGATSAPATTADATVAAAGAPPGPATPAIPAIPAAPVSSPAREAAPPAAVASRRLPAAANARETRGTTSAWGGGESSPGEREEPTSRSAAARERTSEAAPTATGSRGAIPAPGAPFAPPAPVLPAPLKPFASAPPELR
jgi:hypothetical protein